MRPNALRRSQIKTGFEIIEEFPLNKIDFMVHSTDDFWLVDCDSLINYL